MSEAKEEYLLFIGDKLAKLPDPDGFLAAIPSLSSSTIEQLTQLTARKYVALEMMLPAFDAGMITTEGRGERATLDGLRLGLSLLTNDVEASITQASAFFESLSDEEKTKLHVQYAFGVSRMGMRD